MFADVIGAFSIKMRHSNLRETNLRDRLSARWGLQGVTELKAFLCIALTGIGKTIRANGDGHFAWRVAFDNRLRLAIEIEHQ
ncbi:hypothetical protein D3C78_1881830 [compost metagenome]